LHAGAPAPEEKVLTAHLVHFLEAFAGENWPAGQRLGAVIALMSQYQPAGHLTQAALPLRLA
jgi:hypothetical protein